MDASTIYIIWDCPWKIETYGHLKDKTLSCLKQKFNGGKKQIKA